jgi:hypothetical protein
MFDSVAAVRSCSASGAQPSHELAPMTESRLIHGLPNMLGLTLS